MFLTLTAPQIHPCEPLLKLVTYVFSLPLDNFLLKKVVLCINVIVVCIMYRIFF